MKVKLVTIALLVLVIMASCNKSTDRRESTDSSGQPKNEIRHAKGFTMQRFDQYTLIVVRNPWDTTQVLERYILVDRYKKAPLNLPQGTVVKIPVQRVATCSSIFAGEYKKLGELGKIVAVSEPQYVDIPEIKTGLKSGIITDLGTTISLDAEKLIASKPDILVISPFEESMHDRFKKYGICIVKDASYMEESPLGRAEWIRFEAAFIAKDSLAMLLFSKTEKNYTELCNLVSKTATRPTVFTEKKFGDAWYVPGGNSYMGNFLKDAGAKYLWSELKISGSKPLTFETVFSKAIDAQYWIIKYNNTQFDLTYKQLGGEYELYKNFAAFKNKNVFAVNSGTTSYYEDGPLEPDVVLADLVSIFHPEILPGYKSKYYFKLK